MQRKELGFTLIELLVVIVIVGVLTTLAVPRYNRFVAKSRQSEAKTMLADIAMLQDAYKVVEEKYENLNNNGHYVGGNHCGPDYENNKLGFRPSGCEELRYGYSSSGGTTTFTVIADTAQSGNDPIYPGCTEHDRWQIDQDRTLKVGVAPLDPPGAAAAGNAVVLCED